MTPKEIYDTAVVLLLSAAVLHVISVQFKSKGDGQKN